VVALRATTIGGIIPAMDAIEALTESDPKASKKSAGTAAAAEWLRNPTAVEADPNQTFISQLETDAPLCRNCGNIMRRAGSCHTCPDCGESDGCA
jgi:rubrerythrin